uniref:Uncharacterized protein n=1 Tax=Oryza barthii TaxID=65489 RepID=A0A0D3FT99_9ORYZ
MASTLPVRGVMAGGAQGHGDDDDLGTVLSGASGQQPGARERSDIQIGHGDELLGAPGCSIGEKSTWTAVCSKWRLRRHSFGRIQGRRRLRRALNFLFHTDLSTETNKTRREISAGGSGSGGDAFERRSPTAVARGRRLRRQQRRRPTQRCTDPTAALAGGGRGRRRRRLRADSDGRWGDACRRNSGIRQRQLRASPADTVTNPSSRF